MKNFCFVLLSFILPVASGIEKSDLIGKWDCETRQVPEEGVIFKGWESYEFFEDGTFRSNGVGIGTLAEEDQRIFTIGGPEEGTWKIEGDNVHMLTTKMETTFFSSGLEEMNRAEFMKAMPALLKEPTVFSLSSKTEEKLEFKDKDDGSDVTFVRVKRLGKREEAEDDSKKQKREEHNAEVRFISSKILACDGFRYAKNLPKSIDRGGVAGKLRPAGEILDRLLCQYLAMAWVVTNEKQFPSSNIKNLIKVAGLNDIFLKSEREILKTSRSDAPEKFMGSIGWTMENMWALAWVLGFEQDLDIDSAQVDATVITPLAKFLNSAWTDKEAYLKNLKPRSEAEVIQTEDLFYCCHNAVRSAQTGKKGCVPEFFHPAINGGVIHEKRHSLTWVLSPKVKWDDTDLST